jgi:peptidyl-prolyl cis-trans isomerase C
VAREVASCSSEGNCGVVDYFTRGTMPAEFEAAAFSLKPGEVSSPVKTPYGYHVIEILDRKPEAVRQFSEVRDYIERYLRRFLETEKLTAHVVDLKKKADIKVFFP